jgi:hypothetical protein
MPLTAIASELHAHGVGFQVVTAKADKSPKPPKPPKQPKQYFAYVGNKREKQCTAWGFDSNDDAKHKVGMVGFGGTTGDFRGVTTRKCTAEEFGTTIKKQFGFDVTFK